MADTGIGAEDEVLWEMVDDHILLVTLNRPRVRNAINAAITNGLDAMVKKAEADPGIRVVILASSHPTVFCAGADLKEISEGRSHLLATPDHGFAGFVDAPRATPWIAAVGGAALAGGCELVLACDMIVASHDASFGIPEVKRGLFAGAGGVFRLPRVLPRNIGIELVATGDSLSAQDARTFGMVNRLVAADELLPVAITLARAIAVNAPMSVAESLAIAKVSDDRDEDELRALSKEASDRVFASDDAQEGPRAFLEKRAPHWTGR